MEDWSPPASPISNLNECCWNSQSSSTTIVSLFTKFELSVANREGVLFFFPPKFWSGVAPVELILNALWREIVWNVHTFFFKRKREKIACIPSIRMSCFHTTHFINLPLLVFGHCSYCSSLLGVDWRLMSFKSGECNSGFRELSSLYFLTLYLWTFQSCLFLGGRLATFLHPFLWHCFDLAEKRWAAPVRPQRPPPPHLIQKHRFALLIRSCGATSLCETLAKGRSGAV